MNNELYQGLLNDDITMIPTIICFFITNILYYFGLTQLFNVKDINDTVVYVHQAPGVLLFLFGFVYPMMWYFACIHMISHFFAETVFLIYNGAYRFIVHHIYTICFFSIMVMFTPPYICGASMPPIFNNIIYHWSIATNNSFRFKSFRQIYFLLFRIIYPLLAMLYIMIFTDLGWGIKFCISFFAVTIIRLMLPKMLLMYNNKINSGYNY
jgi:hypothetical protein